MKRFLRAGLVPFAIAVALLLLLEGGCRVALRVRTGSWPVTRAEAHTRFIRSVGQAYRTHPFLVVCGRPGGRIDVPGHSVRFNSLGYRGREIAPGKAAGALRVVCEGGSTTFDILARDDAATWPARLETKLGAPWEVVNAGFPGWTSVQSLVSLELRDVDLSPDVVVVFSGANDLQPAGHAPFARDYALGHGELLPRVLGVAPVPLRLVSRSVLLEALGARRVEGYAPAYGFTGARKDEPPPEAVEVFRRNLVSTIAVARAHGARTLLVRQVARFRAGREAEDGAYVESWSPGISARGIQDGLRRYAAAARELAAPDVSVVDPFEDGSFTDADFDDAIHFSASGSERFAEKLAAAIRELRSRAD
jgi:lysophospholipase L1-like esterase